MCCCEPLRTVLKILNGTEGRSRTDTMSPSPDFESGASTNSATPAHNRFIITKKNSYTMVFFYFLYFLFLLFSHVIRVKSLFLTEHRIVSEWLGNPSLRAEGVAIQ